MGYTRGNRVRSTGTLIISPMPNTQVDWCVNTHKANSGLLRAAGYAVTVLDYPMGVYCKECAKEIWKAWNSCIEQEADEGVVVVA